MEKIQPIKINIKKNLYLMRIKVDTNDADFRYHRIEVEEKDVEHIEKMCQALKKKKYKYNFPNGSAYGFSMNQITKSNAYRKFVPLVGKETFEVFKKYMGKKLFHSIHKIELNDTLLYNSEY